MSRNSRVEIPQVYQADWTTLSESILPSFPLCVWPSGLVNSLNMNWVLSLPDWSKTMPRIIQWCPKARDSYSIWGANLVGSVARMQQAVHFKHLFHLFLIYSLPLCLQRISVLSRTWLLINLTSQCRSCGILRTPLATTGVARRVFCFSFVSGVSWRDSCMIHWRQKLSSK